jgi:hypothetical protein
MRVLLSTSSCPSIRDIKVTPVTLPPGRLRLVTWPDLWLMVVCCILLLEIVVVAAFASLRYSAMARVSHTLIAPVVRHLRGGVLDGGDDADISTAATEVAAHVFANLFWRGGVHRRTDQRGSKTETRIIGSYAGAPGTTRASSSGPRFASNEITLYGLTPSAFG